MATCEDCIHYDACYIVELYGPDEDDERCKQFKNKADFVEVVRCKDCIHRIEGCKMCAHPKAIGWDAIEPEDDDFCNYGERKDK